MLDFIPLAFKNLFSKPATRNYPKLVREPFAGQRGHIGIDLPSCIFCGICARKCPNNAIEVKRNEKIWSIDRYKCIMCNECVYVCPKKCLYSRAQYSPPGSIMDMDIFKLETEAKKTSDSTPEQDKREELEEREEKKDA